MATCTAVSGFLTMGGCDNPVASMCTSCGAPRCAVHLSPRSGFTQCLECASQDVAATEKPEEEEDYGEDWLYHRRSSYSDTAPSHQYDRTDAAAFAGTQGLVDDDRDDTDFGDS